MENRLPLINLVESGGADLPDQADVFLVGGKWFRNLTRLSKAGIPTVSLVFGSSTAGGAYFPAMCDYAVMVKEQAKVFLGGPPLVKMATGEESTEEELGGAEMHSKVSGLSDYFAETEHDAIRIGRDIVGHFNWRKQGMDQPTRPTIPSMKSMTSRRYPRRSACAIRHALDPGKGPRRLTIRGVQGSPRDVDSQRLGIVAWISDRCHRQPTGGDFLRGGPKDRRVHPALQPLRHPHALHSQHNRIHGW